MGKVNPWVEEAFRRVEAKRRFIHGIPAVVEVESGKALEVASNLRRLGYSVEGVVNDFVFVDLPEPADFEMVARLPYVRLVSVQKKLYPMALGIDELFKRVAIATHPLLSKLDITDLNSLGIKVKPASELPTPFNALVTIVSEALKFAADPLWRLMEYVRGFPPVIARADWKLVTDTRKLMEAPDENKIDIKVGVIDTGVRPGPLIGLPLIDYNCVSITIEPPVDTMSHGCLRNVNVYTSYCGVVNIEELWYSLDTEPQPVMDGEFKPFREHEFTIDLNGVTKVGGIFRTKSKKKVVIETPLGIIEATPWHEFYVANPKKNKIKWDSHRRLYCSYDLLKKRADELKPKGINNEGDWLIFKAYNGETWSIGGDVRLAYLGGLVAGDGVIEYRGVYVKTGKVVRRRVGEKLYKTSNSEIRIFDEDDSFLERIKSLYGGKMKSRRGQGKEVDIYSVKLVRDVIPYLRPPVNDLEALRAWLAGFFDAEGYVNHRDKTVSISSVDIGLLELLRDVLNTVGVPSTVTSGGVSKGSRIYHLTILVPQLFYKFIEPYCIKRRDELSRVSRSEDSSSHGRKVKFDGKYVLVPVRGVKVVNCDEYFYDLANTTNRNYSASGFIVSNSWCESCAFGREGQTRFGYFKPVAEGYTYHVKVFTALGPCSSFQVMKAMEMCAEEGCRVVNMSLGSPLEGSVNEDPECVLAEKLYKQYGTNFVVAAGNDGEEWSINSPAASPYVLCVSAIDWKTMDTSSYSSRGPQGRWYRDNKDAFDRDYQKYGEAFLKPDVAGIGGDMDSQIVAACCPWYDGFYDFTPDLVDMMIGTSMSTPHCSGLVALAIDRGLVKNINDVKVRMARYGRKSIDKGYGLLLWSKLK